MEIYAIYLLGIFTEVAADGQLRRLSSRPGKNYNRWSIPRSQYNEYILIKRRRKLTADSSAGRPDFDDFLAPFNIMHADAKSW